MPSFSTQKKENQENKDTKHQWIKEQMSWKKKALILMSNMIDNTVR